MEKLKSRKFWICVAAFLASIGTSIAGIHSNNETITSIGTVCTIFSAAIYAFAEAWVDGKAASGDVYVNELSVEDDDEEE